MSSTVMYYIIHLCRPVKQKLILFFDYNALDITWRTQQLQCSSNDNCHMITLTYHPAQPNTPLKSMAACCV